MRPCSASKTGLSRTCSPTPRADPPLLGSALLWPVLSDRAAAATYAAGSKALAAVAIDIGIVAWAAVETWITWP